MPPRARSSARKARPKSARRQASAPGKGIEILVSLICCAIFVHQAYQMMSAFHWNAVDDAYISFRYADNLASGHGLAWNEGERVEGYSNFLWVCLLCPFQLAVDDLTVISQVLGLLIGCATIVLTIHSARRLVPDKAPVAMALAGSLVASSGYYSSWAVSGMETALHSSLLLLGWVVFASELERGGRGARLAAVPIVALALLRPEGIFVALAAIAVHVVLSLRRGNGMKSRATLAFPAIVLACLVAYHGFRFSYFGVHLWPNSVDAKVGFSLAQLSRGFEYLWQDFLVPYAPLLLFVIPAAWFAPEKELRIKLGVSLLLGYLLFVAAVGGDWSYGRFFAPLLPLSSVLFAAAYASAIEFLQGHFPGRRGAYITWLMHSIAVVFVVFAWKVTAADRENQFRLQYAEKDEERIAIGRWLASSAPAGTTVAVYAAGQIPYYSHLKSHDMLGLNDEHIAGVERDGMGRGTAGHERFDVEYTLEKIRPDVIVDPQYIPGMLDHPSLKTEYRRERGFVRSLVLVKRGLSVPAPRER